MPRGFLWLSSDSCLRALVLLLSSLPARECSSFYKSMVEEGLTGGKLGAGKSGMLFYFSKDKRCGDHSCCLLLLAMPGPSVLARRPWLAAACPAHPGLSRALAASAVLIVYGSCCSYVVKTVTRSELKFFRSILKR